MENRRPLFFYSELTYQPHPGWLRPSSSYSRYATGGASPRCLLDRLVRTSSLRVSSLRKDLVVKHYERCQILTAMLHRCHCSLLISDLSPRRTRRSRRKRSRWSPLLPPGMSNDQPINPSFETLIPHSHLVRPPLSCNLFALLFLDQYLELRCFPLGGPDRDRRLEPRENDLLATVDWLQGRLASFHLGERTSFTRYMVESFKMLIISFAS
ncbi:hypothetical protein Cni_G15160 [Canna indica]|uniref:Uncharacterized protein n=1 Tax=Canna indica TaxID=4628 RepID=A0AAQ3QBA9_9LILI|nr:hypothetical protein Cni_G15160 [Canna indica]